MRMKGRCTSNLADRTVAADNSVPLVFCYSHVRKRLHELAAAGPAPVDSGALSGITELLTNRMLSGTSPAKNAAMCVRRRAVRRRGALIMVDRAIRSCRPGDQARGNHPLTLLKVACWRNRGSRVKCSSRIDPLAVLNGQSLPLERAVH